MKIAISQPRYLPALNYLQRILLVDTFVLMDNVQYTPRDWENRNRIRTWNGTQWLSVPIAGHHQGRLLQDTIIDNSTPWQRKHYQALVLNYKKAPYFHEMQSLLAEVYEVRRWQGLCELNFYLIEAFLQYLGIKRRLVWASEVGVNGAGCDQILNLCRRLGATTYISGSLGRGYLASEQFKQAQIDLLYHDYDPQPYGQVHGEPFIPWVAAIDLLMNHGPASSEKLAAGVALKES